jgi:type III pantothenate kinase
MKLLVDAGNSRIKWGVHNGTDWCAQGAVLHEDIGLLKQAWARWPIVSAHASVVARPEIRVQLEGASPCAVHWVEAQLQGFGIRNHYREPRQMGADRWLAVLAARRLSLEPLLVVCAGTALTIESLSADGDYLGGVILPGWRVMLDSLAQNTARLDLPAGVYTEFPHCTEDALATGVLDALAGAVERSRCRLAAYSANVSPLVLITGGDARQIAPLLASPVQIVDNLVLMGLLEVSNES